MNKAIQPILLPIFACICIMQACSDDGYTADPQHLLAFSADTLNLDTIFADTGTSTYTIKVYNRNKKPLLISSVSLPNASKSGFRINVDGSKGTHFTDIEISGKDSIYIFVEATVNLPDTDLPVQVKDSIVFLTNGMRQDIKLIACGQNAFVMKGKIVSADTAFTAKRPILIYDSLYVDKDVTLTLEQGTRLFFHKDAGLKVSGTIIANGSISSPVLMRGDRTDRMSGNLPYDRLPGQWEGIRFYTSSYANKLDYVTVNGTTRGIQCDSSAIEKTKITITGSRISQVSGNAVSLTSCTAIIANTEISNAGNNCVMLLGGNYDFVHCTIANYYSWNIRRGAALYMANSNNETDYPLHKASFRNCIIVGSSAEELYGVASDDQNIPYNFYFSHSLISAKEEGGNEINNVIWAKDDHFKLIDNDTQSYDFRLDPSSNAVDIGLLRDAASFPADRNGISRVSDKAPDAGCYEFVQ